MKKIFLGIVVCAFQFAAAQMVEVVSIKQLPVDGGFYFPVISPAGNYLLASHAGYSGLVKIDLATNEETVLSTASFSGYYPSISADEKKIAYREDSYKDNVRYVSVKLINLLFSTNNPAEKMAPSRDYSGMYLGNRSLTIAQGRKATYTIVDNAAKESKPLLLTVEDGLMALYKNGVRTELAPNGTDKRYIWASISPDRKKIVYTTPPQQTWVCTIHGQNPVAIEYLGAPQWLGNKHIIGMNDKDNGDAIIASSIDVVSIDGKKRQTLTPSSMIAMYPTVSANGKTVACHTSDGKIYIITITSK